MNEFEELIPINPIVKPCVHAAITPKLGKWETTKAIYAKYSGTAARLLLLAILAVLIIITIILMIISIIGINNAMLNHKLEPINRDIATAQAANKTTATQDKIIINNQEYTDTTLTVLAKDLASGNILEPSAALFLKTNASKLAIWKGKIVSKEYKKDEVRAQKTLLN